MSATTAAPASAGSSNVVELRGIAFRYPGGSEILKDCTLSIRRGQLLFLTGASGAGKSTLLRIIGLIERPTRGSVMVNGLELGKLKTRQIPAYRRQIGMIFQGFSLLKERTVFDNVALPLLIAGMSGMDVGRRVRAALDAVGLLGKERAYPITLSGGEQQRVGIARAVVSRPVLLLADEPTGNLDAPMAMDVMRLFMRFNEVGVSVIVSTHALGLIRRLEYPILHLKDGRVHEAPEPTEEEARLAQ